MNAKSAANQDAGVVLAVEHITKIYEEVVALDDVSLSFSQGAVHAIAGGNGAGKSTLIKIISGCIPPTQGTLAFQGRTYSAVTPRQARELGVGVIYQELNLVPELSVAENVFLGSFLGNGAFVDQNAMERRTEEIFDRLGVKVDPAAKVNTLGIAQMKFVEIARAFAQDLRVLIMDEPTASLTNQESEMLFTLIDILKEHGVSVIYITHRLNEIYRISSLITVMCDGKVIATRPTDELPQDELIRLMLQKDIKDVFPPKGPRSDEVMLEVKNLQGAGVAPVSFNLHKGEILGIAGLMGSGRTELVRLLFGADCQQGGEIFLNGKRITIRSPEDAVRLGFGFLPENRKEQGILLEMSVQDNIVLPILRQISKFTLVQRDRESSIVKIFMKKLGILNGAESRPVSHLSGGNQQKVAISKWLASSSRILIFDEPTIGIDMGVKHEIYQAMDKLSEQGISIILVSSDMDELFGMADRILVLRDGKIVQRLEDCSAVTQEQILQMTSSGYHREKCHV